jgi:hypothetical protein
MKRFRTRWAGHPITTNKPPSMHAGFRATHGPPGIGGGYDGFDRLEEVMASGLVEKRRQLVACYVHRITADPTTQRVEIGLIPTVVSEIVAGAGFEPAAFGL